MKKALAILLLICLTAPFAGSYCWLHYEAYLVSKDVKRQILTGMDRDELILLSFTTAEAENLKWKHAREFEFNSNLYDIVELETQGDTTLYWCWLDSKETRLGKQLDQLITMALDKDPQNKNNRNHPPQRISTYYLINPISWSLSQEEPPALQPRSPGFSDCSVSFSPPAPPPKTV